MISWYMYRTEVNVMCKLYIPIIMNTLGVIIRVLFAIMSWEISPQTVIQHQHTMFFLLKNYCSLPDDKVIFNLSELYFKIKVSKQTYYKISWRLELVIQTLK